jgi:hypothetical protein
MPIGNDEPGFASIARLSYLTASDWQDRYRIAAFVWVVPVEYRERYTDIYVLNLVKGVVGEVADLSLVL